MNLDLVRSLNAKRQNINFNLKKSQTMNKKSNHCFVQVSNGGISSSSDFASRNKDIYLTFILNCRSDYLVAYPQKEQKIYKTKLSRIKLSQTLTI